MNAFQIIDKNTKEALSINKIDEIAAKFWQQDVKEKEYAVPHKKEEYEYEIDYYTQTNWYDMIGRAIIEARDDDWEKVREYLIGYYMYFRFVKNGNLVQFEKRGENTIGLPEETEVSIYNAIKYLDPYFKLIKHFEELGLEPKQV